MVTNWLLERIVGLWTWIWANAPQPPAVPVGIGDLSSNLSTWGTQFVGMGAWIPTQIAVAMLTAVFACWLVAFGVHIVRIVASFLTLGGGAT